MTATVHCPHCNATVPLTALPPSHRVVCPRCGEGFPVKEPVTEDGSRLPTESLNGPPPAVPPPPPPRSVGAFALAGVALAAVILVVGWFVFLRKSDGPSGDPTQATKPTTTVPPAALAALGHLPDDANVLIVAQPGPLLAFAERTQADPKQVLAQSGLPDRLVAALDKLGVRPEQIDHVAVGLSVGPRDVVPRAVVALQLTAPLPDRGAFLKQLKAVQMTVASGATRYKTDIGLPITTEMANPDPTTYLFATDGKDLDAAPRGRGAAHLPAGLRESMARLSPASCVWVATDTSNWADKPAVQAAAALLQRPELPARLASVRAVALGTSLEPQPKLTTAIRWTDPEAAKRFQDQTANALAGKPVQIGGDGPWVTIEGTPDRDVWGGLLELLPAPKK
jgi:hypothetical protein